jgi:hypothetical protein
MSDPRLCISGEGRVSFLEGGARSLGSAKPKLIHNIDIVAHELRLEDEHYRRERPGADKDQPASAIALFAQLHGLKSI